MTTHNMCKCAHSYSSCFSGNQSTGVKYPALCASMYYAHDTGSQAGYCKSCTLCLQFECCVISDLYRLALTSHAGGARKQRKNKPLLSRHDVQRTHTYQNRMGCTPKKKFDWGAKSTLHLGSH